MTAFQEQNLMDPRVRQTRAALFEAFTSLVLNRDYEVITIADIISSAGVSRSTFYQHFRNKDDILAESMRGILMVLTDAACGASNHESMLRILDHLWENRQLARRILIGKPYRALTRQHAKDIEQRIWNTRFGDDIKPVQLQLEAVQLAEGQWGTIRAWLREDVRCSAREVATHLAG